MCVLDEKRQFYTSNNIYIYIYIYIYICFLFCFISEHQFYLSKITAVCTQLGMLLSKTKVPYRNTFVFTQSNIWLSIVLDGAGRARDFFFFARGRHGRHASWGEGGGGDGSHANLNKKTVPLNEAAN